MTRGGIGLFARAPSAPGKTRLAPYLSRDRHRALREALLRDAIEVVCGVDGFDTVVFFTPVGGRTELAAIVPPAVTLVPQEGRDLGERMCHAVGWLLTTGRHACAILVGSDVPLLRSDDLVDAGKALHSGSELVLGPADDGGYYLIGTARDRPRLFNDISWGSAAVLSQTQARAGELGVTPRLLRRTYDLDTIDDLRRVERDLELSPHAAGRHLRAWFSDGT